MVLSRSRRPVRKLRGRRSRRRAHCESTPTSRAIFAFGTPAAAARRACCTWSAVRDSARSFYAPRPSQVRSLASAFSRIKERLRTTSGRARRSHRRHLQRVRTALQRAVELGTVVPGTCRTPSRRTAGRPGEGRDPQDLLLRPSCTERRPREGTTSRLIETRDQLRRPPDALH